MINKVAIGVDRGFGATKYYSDLISGHVDSLVAPIDKSRALDLIKNNTNDDSVIIIKDINDNYFLVGSYVALVEPNYAERDLRRNRDSVNETILFITGMGLATGELEEVEVVVTTGLPTDDFDKLEKSYATSIVNDHNPYEFTIYRGGKTFNKSIVVSYANIENQPKGTVITTINEKLSNKETWATLKSQKFGICDIGFNTTDASMYVGKDIIKGEKNNFSTFAMVQILSSIKKLVEDKFNCKKSEDEILLAMQTNEVKVKGKIVDCKEEIQQGFEKNADLLVNEISSKWEEYLDTLDEIILTGGAIENAVFYNLLVGMFKKKTGWDVCKPNKAQYANAFGFYLISSSILQKLN